MNQNRVKYPRTPHLPFSLGRTNDDRVLPSLDHLEGKECVVTLKMDGENTTLYRNGFHARSLDSRHHPSQDWLARFHATFAHEIPEGWRICGENVYAKHSIAYTGLPSYFLGFSIWDEANRALSWTDTLMFFAEFGITPVQEVSDLRGPFEASKLEQLAKNLDVTTHEGFVVRLAGEIRYEDFGTSYAKWVRASHVQTDKHWKTGPIVPNELGA